MDSAEITRIACKTFFAGRQCLAGINGAHKGGVLDQQGRVTFQVGAYAFDNVFRQKVHKLRYAGTQSKWISIRDKNFSKDWEKGKGYYIFEDKAK